MPVSRMTSRSFRRRMKKVARSMLMETPSLMDRARKGKKDRFSSSRETKASEP